MRLRLQLGRVLWRLRSRRMRWTAMIPVFKDGVQVGFVMLTAGGWAMFSGSTGTWIGTEEDRGTAEQKVRDAEPPSSDFASEMLIS